MITSCYGDITAHLSLSFTRAKGVRRLRFALRDAIPVYRSVSEKGAYVNPTSVCRKIFRVSLIYNFATSVNRLKFCNINVIYVLARVTASTYVHTRRKYLSFQHENINLLVSLSYVHLSLHNDPSSYPILYIRMYKVSWSYEFVVSLRDVPHRIRHIVHYCDWQEGEERNF